VAGSRPRGVGVAARYGKEVCTWLYEDALRVTEVQPLPALVLSGRR
jgi:hypothetical protein